MKLLRPLCAALLVIGALAVGTGSAQAATAITPWDSTFETEDFTEWDWWGVGDPAWGTISVENPFLEGIPWLTDLSVGRFEVSATDITNGRVHAKLYKDWSWEDGGGVEHPPDDISAAFSAWYYVPSGYTVPTGAATNIFQFKEKYFDDGEGGSVSVPTHWVNLSTADWALNLWPDGGRRWIGELPTDPEQPVLHLACASVAANPDGCWDDRTFGFQAAPLDRWFEIRAEVHQDDRIDLFVDGVLLESVSDSVRPVAPTHPRSENWTFGVGNYHTGDPGDPNVLYVDGAEAELLGTTAPTASTQAATLVTSDSAALKGTVNPNRLATTYWFEYGTTMSYGSRAPATAAAVGSDGTAHAVARAITGLRGNTRYHYRVVARNSAGTTYGSNVTFTTSS